MQRHEKPIGIAIADGFSPQDLYQGEYTRPLQEAAYPIIEQNRRLLTQIGMRGFRPAVDLDFTSNGAGVWIRQFFECVAEDEEGREPWRAAKELFVTTDMLIDALKGLKNAPVSEIEAAGVAFRQAAILWKDNHPRAKMERKTYLKKHFASEKEICDKLNALHAAYVRIYAAKGRKKGALSAVQVLCEESGKAAERKRIFAEIDRLVNLGNSIPKAIAIMKRGSYEARMRGVKAETWKRYYVGHCRIRELGRRKNETVNETVNERKNETVNVPKNETVNEIVSCRKVQIEGENAAETALDKSERNETVNGEENETVKRQEKVSKNETVNETVKSKRKSVGGCHKIIMRLIKRRPGVTVKEILFQVGKSRATVMRYIADLKDSREIEYRGAAKSGGYYVVG